MPKKLILVGGFLGSGKTTLIGTAAKKLQAAGNKVGIVTNDQTSQLVDTIYLETIGDKVKEVNGSCFCCNFPGFMDAVKYVEPASDFILAEPVGSCTDLSATIMQPLKDRYGKDFSTAPFSVLADPNKISQILAGGIDGINQDAAYIVGKQLDEADYVVINKIDLLDEAEKNDLIAKAKDKWSNATIIALSGKTGEGVQEWLDAIIKDDKAGQNIVDVDYDTYAAGEACLGWLNSTIRLKGSHDADQIVKDLMEALSAEFKAQGSTIGHVKVLDVSGSSFIAANITGDRDDIIFNGSVGKTDYSTLTVNARAEMDEVRLENIIRDTLAKTAGDITVDYMEMNTLIPGYPDPTYHYDSVQEVNS